MVSSRLKVNPPAALSAMGGARLRISPGGPPENSRLPFQKAVSKTVFNDWFFELRLQKPVSEEPILWLVLKTRFQELNLKKVIFKADLGGDVISHIVASIIALHARSGLLSGKTVLR